MTKFFCRFSLRRNNHKLSIFFVNNSLHELASLRRELQLFELTTTHVSNRRHVRNKQSQYIFRMKKFYFSFSIFFIFLISSKSCACYGFIYFAVSVQTLLSEYRKHDRNLKKRSPKQTLGNYPQTCVEFTHAHHALQNKVFIQGQFLISFA